MVADTQTESEFEYAPFSDLYRQALRDVSDGRLDERARNAAARTIAFLLREQLVTERVATDVLVALHRSLDVSKVVRTLLLGLVDVSAPEKIAEWTRHVAGRTVQAKHLPSFLSAMRVLVELRDYDGVVPTRWRLSILRASEIPELTPRVLRFAKAYKRRFPHESWPWIRKALHGSTILMLRRRPTAEDVQRARDS